MKWNSIQSLKRIKYLYMLIWKALLDLQDNPEVEKGLLIMTQNPEPIKDWKIWLHKIFLQICMAKKKSPYTHTNTALQTGREYLYMPQRVNIPNTKRALKNWGTKDQNLIESERYKQAILKKRRKKKKMILKHT